jgi:hypothetical protein
MPNPRRPPTHQLDSPATPHVPRDLPVFLCWNDRVHFTVSPQRSPFPVDLRQNLAIRP